MAKIFKSSKKPAARRSAQPAPAQPQRLEIVRLADDGRGVAHCDGKVVFVENALPREVVSAQWQRRQKRFDEALAIEILTPSPQRQSPACQHAANCGGCQLQHLQPGAQRDHKRERLQSILRAQGGAAEVRLLSGDDLGYRHRARLSYRAGHLGFRAAASHQLIDIQQCPVLEPPLEQAVMASRAVLLKALQSKKSAELHFAVDDEGRIGLSLELQERADMAWCEALKAALQPLELHRVNAANDAWEGGFAAMRYGGEWGVQFVPGDFSQANRRLNAAMLEQAMQWLSPQSGEQVVDYFCGLGNFSLPLAAAGASVLALDMGEQMLARAASQAAALGLTIEFARADLFSADNIALRGATKVLLDPPRAGAKAVCSELAASSAAQSLVYVSCDPASLARDLSILADGGFQIRDAVAVDMFPHTHHLESMVWLSRPSAG